MKRILIVAVALSLFAGCQHKNEFKKKPVVVDQGAPAAELSSQKEAARANNDFAFDLLRQLERTGNVTYSPMSIQSVLSMAMAGADGETAGQMAQTLNADDVEDYHAKMGALGWQIGAGDNASALRISDDLWVDDELGLQKSYAKSLRDTYGATVHPVDFDQPAAAADTINGRIAEVTDDLIEEIVTPESFNDMTALVLTNATYLDADWEKPFSDEKTQQRPFHLAGDDTVMVDMMYQEETFRYGEHAGLRLVELPYEDTHLTAVGILPEDEPLEKLEARLDADTFAELRGKMGEREIEVALPLLKLSSELPLTDTLKAMGIEDAFTREANFGKIADEPIFVSHVEHAAFLELDETGTEAAAATSAEGKAMAVADPPRFIADRPFLLFVIDERTDAIIFMARVTDPTSE